MMEVSSKNHHSQSKWYKRVEGFVELQVSEIKINKLNDSCSEEQPFSDDLGNLQAGTHFTRLIIKYFQINKSE